MNRIIRVNLLHRVESFMGHVYSHHRPFVLWASAFFSLYISVLLIEKPPQSVEQIYYEGVWCLWVIAFVLVTPYMIRAAYERFGEQDPLVLTKRQEKWICIFLIICYVFYAILWTYDVMSAPAAGFWLAGYGKIAASIHYLLGFAYGIPILIYDITLSVKMLNFIYSSRMEIESIDSVEEFFKNLKRLKCFFETIDQIFLLMFILVALFALASLIAFLTLMDLGTYFVLTGLVAFASISFLTVTLRARKPLKESCTMVLNKLLLPDSFTGASFPAANYLFSLIMHKNSPYYLPVDNSGPKMKIVYVGLIQMALIFVELILQWMVF